MVEQLREMTHRGVDVLILTATNNEQAEYLQAKGLCVKVLSCLSLCTTIIDRAVVWYGAINMLGYASEEDNAIKVTDKNLANDLLGVLSNPNSA